MVPAPTLPAQWYVKHDVYDRERRAVFASHWLYGAHESELPRRGSYVTLDVAGFSVVIVRDHDGALRAFHNVCRHRAGPLVDEPAGSCSRFVCRYHGWAYGLDGALTSQRDFDEDRSAPTADACEALRLVPVRVETFRRLVFVCLEDADVSLATWLDGFAELLEPFGVEDLRWAGRRTYAIRCNWKTYMDNFNEGYHIPLVHPGLARQIDARSYRVIDCDTGRWCRHEAVPTDGALVTNGLWAGVFPNLGVNLVDEGLFIERAMPTGPETMDLLVDFYAVDPDAAAVSAVMDGNEEVTQEDIAICEAVQKNLRAGVYQVGVLSPRHEDALAGFHRRVEALLR